MLDWDFILDVIRARRFGAKWINLINCCLVGGKSQILVNGHPAKIINSRRGLKQGDHLSPLLFVIAGDIFTQILRVSSSNGIIRGIQPSGFEEEVISLQHADGTLLFCQINNDYILALKLILYCNELVSGLKINFNKSSVILIEHNEARQREIATNLNCISDKFPIKYIGIPLRPEKLHKEVGCLLSVNLIRDLRVGKGTACLEEGGWCWLMRF